jgi:hypothetical protein
MAAQLNYSLPPSEAKADRVTTSVFTELAILVRPYLLSREILPEWLQS